LVEVIKGHRDPTEFHVTEPGIHRVLTFEDKVRAVYRFKSDPEDDLSRSKRDLTAIMIDANYKENGDLPKRVVVDHEVAVSS